MSWQLQEAKQRLSEVVRDAQTKGPQVVTRHGEEVAVIVAMDDYRRMSRDVPDLKDYLLSGPRADDFEAERSRDRGREVRLG